MSQLKNNYCIIMAGGIGSRFWPMSTVQRPKQFLDVLGIGKSLLRMTFERLSHIAPTENIYIMTNASYAQMVAEQLPELKPEQILQEPERKNTAPCIAYAAAKICARDPNATLVVAPSDHLILKEDNFRKVIQTAIETATKDNRLVTLGIKPTRPDTGYGYIEFVEQGDNLPGQVKAVKHFTEKPNRELAEIFLKSGNYYWNSGIFIWKADTILDALKKFQPDLHRLFAGELNAYNQPKEQEFVNHCFATCEDISIDFAVMEHAKNVDVVLATFDWSDLGTWGSLYTHLDKDYNGNAVVNGNVHLVNSENCIVNLPKDKLALIQGLDNYIVVESDNMLMILNQHDEQNIKKYLAPLEEANPRFFPKN
jgi:mannose-1-phosphate guanylyltransferase